MKRLHINKRIRDFAALVFRIQPNIEMPSQSSLCWRVPAVCLALAAITFAVFGQTLRHEFIDFDDNEYVYENPVVARGLTLKGIVWAASSFHAANWHPLTWLSHMLDCQLYGLHPGGHHLTNVLLHTGTVIALFLVLRRMTGAFWRSAFVAAVFAIHPLRVESVAWVAERKDVLSGLFFMLTIGAYVCYARRAWSLPRYGLVVLLFAMGLMCKPMLVTLPVVLLLLDYWPLQRVETRKISGLVLEKLPLLALSAAACVATLLAQAGAIQSAEFYSLRPRFGNALVTCLIYLGQMVWPSGLAAFYPFPVKGPPAWEVALTGVLLASLLVAAWGERRKQPWLLMGWLWYLAMLLPVIGVIQVGMQAHADRYTYLPQIGIYMAVTWLAAEWRFSRVAFGSLMAGVLAVLMVCAWKQTAYWENTETLWNHTLACTKGNIVAHLNLGHDLSKKGRLDEAISFYQKGLQTEPDNAASENNLGNVLCEKGRVDEGIAHYKKALQIKPAFAEAQFNLGKAFRLEGKVDEAIVQFQKALQIKPDFAPALFNLGNTFLQQGKADQAVAQFQRALEINPTNAGIHLNLGLCFSQLGRMDEAILQYEKALQLEPADPKIQNNLAWLLATCPGASLRDGNKAVELARQANELTGGKNPIILHTLAAAFAEAGRFPEAVETAQRALHLAEAQSNPDLAGQLQSEMKLYEAGLPFHGPAQTH
jgi:tetratricopeptide (TPR) repeat protein